MVSQPYVNIGSDRWKTMFKEMSEYADKVGWYCTDHSEWSWYYPSKTALVMMQPKTPIQETLELFEASFKKFVVETWKKYQRLLIPRLEDVIERIVYDDCFPLNVTSLDQLNSEYLHRFRRMKLDWEDPDDRELIEAYKFLFNEWETAIK